MASDKTDIIVYAHWQGISDPVKMGVLTALEARGHLAWSFSYDKKWLNTQSQLQLDPDLVWFTGPQYSRGNKPTFGIFLESMPDTWGGRLCRSEKPC